MPKHTLCMNYKSHTLEAKAVMRGMEYAVKHGHVVCDYNKSVENVIGYPTHVQLEDDGTISVEWEIVDTPKGLLIRQLDLTRLEMAVDGYRKEDGTVVVRNFVLVRP